MTWDGLIPCSLLTIRTNNQDFVGDKLRLPEQLEVAGTKHRCLIGCIQNETFQPWTPSFIAAVLKLPGNRTTMDAPPYTPRIEFDGHSYFPSPYSLEPLPSDLRDGLIPVAVLAMLSVGATLTLISFIVYRLITWRMHYRTFIGYNQYVLLVLNLLIADMQQSSAFLVSWHWIRLDAILAPSAPCFAQAWLLHSGDVSSGFFVLAIAVHTFITAVSGKRIGHKTFFAVIVCIWCFAYLLTGIGVGLYKYVGP